MRLARHGDEAAFAGLVHAFQDLAVAYATSLLRDVHLAEDAVQEAFVDAHRLLPSLRDPLAFASWFRTIVFKHCERLMRRKGRWLSGLDSALSVASPDASPHDALELRETRESLRRAIATLSDAEQQVVLLYYMGDHSQADIARFLDITPNTVKTRLYAARRRLRRHMADIDKDLGAARPSGDPSFARRIERLIRPEALKQRKPWLWSPGIGTDVWEMFVACMAGDLETVRRLVEKDPSLIRSHYEYRTPLSFAVRENQLGVAEFLLDRGAAAVGLGDPLEMARDRGYTGMETLLQRKLDTLHGASTRVDAVAEAIRSYDPARVRELLDASPGLVHAGDHSSNQPIHWATMTRQIPLIDELLRRGADIDARRIDGARPIHLTNGDYDYRGWRDVPDHVTTTPDRVYRHLVRRGATVDIWMAAVSGDESRVRELLDQDPSLVNRVNDYNSYYAGCGSALKNAAAAGHIGIVRLLLERGADPNLPEEGIAPRGHALYSAVSNHHYDVAWLLLEHGANPDAPVESSADAVWIAIRGEDRRMIELLASHGATWEIPLPIPGKLTYRDIVAMGLARSVPVLAYYGDTATAAPMFEKDPSLADSPEALQNAASSGHLEFVQLLLKYHPELAKRVTVTRPREMAEFLFARGMDPNRPDWMRKTPLHHFAGDGDIESATLFLDHGADINARDEEHCSTALAFAAKNGKLRMVEFLLRRGAKPSLADDPPWATPVAWAARRGHSDIVELLEEYQRTGALSGRSLAEYDSLAEDLAAAFRSGDDAALQRIAEFFPRRPLFWDRPSRKVLIQRVRAFVRNRLGREADTSETLPIEDARELIARAAGFGGWSALQRETGG